MNSGIIFLIGLLVGGLTAFVYENSISKITGKQKLVISGYKLHHSLYGVLLILMAIFYPTNAIILISAGLGVIVEHYLTGGGFDFITKEKSSR